MSQASDVSEPRFLKGAAAGVLATAPASDCIGMFAFGPGCRKRGAADSFGALRLDSCFSMSLVLREWRVSRTGYDERGGPFVPAAENSRLVSGGGSP